MSASIATYTFSEAFGSERYDRSDICVKTGDVIGFVYADGPLDNIIGTVTGMTYRGSICTAFDLVRLTDGFATTYRTGLLGYKEDVIVFYGPVAGKK